MPHADNGVTSQFNVDLDSRKGLVPSQKLIYVDEVFLYGNTSDPLYDLHNLHVQFDAFDVHSTRQLTKYPVLHHLFTGLACPTSMNWAFTLCTLFTYDVL